MNLENLSIVDYMENRIKNNKIIYQKYLIEDDLDKKNINKDIFKLFYFLLIKYLENGHTILTLNDKDWIKNTVEDALYYIMKNKDLISYKNIEEISEQIYNLKNNQDDINLLLIDIKNNFKNLFLEKLDSKKNIIEENILAEKSYDVYLSILRFHYFCFYSLNESLERFINSISNSSYFVSAKNTHKDKLIIFFYNHNKDEVIMWINRIFHAEYYLYSNIKDICNLNSQIFLYNTKDINENLDKKLNKEQILAIHNIYKNPISIITGGPGTGKTFTIAQIVYKIYQDNPELNLALVAPTGKAGQRMKESLQKAINEQQNSILLPDPMTIHRLLGVGESGIPYYHEKKPLPYEMIIIDEASMLGIELAKNLFMALKPNSKIILLGDTHQLSSVDAGSVLFDLCQLDVLKDKQTHLLESKRFNEDSGIGRLADLVNKKDFINTNKLEDLINNSKDLFLKKINNFNYLNINEVYFDLLHPYQNGDDSYFGLTKEIKNKFYKLSEDQKKHYLEKLNQSFNKYRILTASHLSLCGDHQINDYIKIQHRNYLELSPEFAKFSWYHGRPVMILKNRYDLGLFNGDIGICLQNGIKANQLAVYFYDKTLKVFPINVLDGDIVSSSYAMTIHKSQGSEFDKVAIIFNDDDQKILSKELVYTAITRAKKSIDLYTTESALQKAINTPIQRQTGLKAFEQIKFEQ